MGVSVYILILHRMGEQLKDSVRIWWRFPQHLLGYLCQSSGVGTLQKLLVHLAVLYMLCR